MRILLLLLAALVVGPSVATSQEPPSNRYPAPANTPDSATQAQKEYGKHTRQGFWFNAGLGYGSASCLDCNIRTGSLSGGVALGGALSQKVMSGVGTNRWWKSEDGATLMVETLAAVMRLYPSATGGFFLLGGLGLGMIHRAAYGFGSDTEAGFGALLGLGIDIRVARNVSLTPFWNAFVVAMNDDDANVGQIGLGVTVH